MHLIERQYITGATTTFYYSQIPTNIQIYIKIMESWHNKVLTRKIIFYFIRYEEIETVRVTLKPLTFLNSQHGILLVSKHWSWYQVAQNTEKNLFEKLQGLMLTEGSRLSIKGSWIFSRLSVFPVLVKKCPKVRNFISHTNMYIKIFFKSNEKFKTNTKTKQNKKHHVLEKFRTSSSKHYCVNYALWYYM